MTFRFENFWKYISFSGTSYASTKREKNEIILINRAWFILVLIQFACLAAHIINKSERPAFMTATFIAGLGCVFFLIRIGMLNLGKIAAIAVINFNTVFMSIFLGAETHLIDFLLLTALLPLYFFEIKNKHLIFWGIALSVIPFCLYHFTVPYLGSYALPLDDQLIVYNTINPMKVFSLSVLLYLIYCKNRDYEIEVQEKETQLAGQKQLYEHILEQIPIDIATFDKELKFSYINSNAVKDPDMREKLIGKTNKEYFLERKIDMRVAEARDKLIAEAQEQGKTLQMEETMVEANGKVTHSIKGAAPIYGKDESDLLCIIGYSLDITSIKEAECKLQEYAKELERKNGDLYHFVNATSHDLKTPLRTIASYLQLLQKKNEGKLDADSLSLIDYTVKNVKHLNRLIGDIYQYSIADKNDKPAEITNLNELLKEAMIQMAEEITDKGAVVQFTELPTLRISPGHLNMIFTNLVGNALKYNDSEHPKISVGCEQSDEEYILHVSDNGIGIDEAYKTQVFEIFKRLHTTDVYEGTGVGLAICSKIVENYNGRMWVESVPGLGSTFYFSLSKALVSKESCSSHKIGAYKKLAIAG